MNSSVILFLEGYMSSESVGWVKELCFWYDTVGKQIIWSDVLGYEEVDAPARCVVCVRMRSDGRAFFAEEGMVLPFDKVFHDGRERKTLPELLFTNIEISFGKYLSQECDKNPVTLAEFEKQVEDMRRERGGTYFGGKIDIGALGSEWLHVACKE